MCIKTNQAIQFFLILLLFNNLFVFGQIEQYNYMRELKGVTDQWHSIHLPAEIFGKTAHDLSDIRIFGIKANKDAVEAPYLLQVASEKVSRNEIPFKMLNTTYKGNEYYFTLELPTMEAINEIKLAFKQSNFDWSVKLVGSQNQEDWFTLAENYRILSIKNELTDYAFTKLLFPSAKYRFYQLIVNSKEKPEIVSATVSQIELIEGKINSYAISWFEVNENKQAKQTEIDIALYMPVKVSKLKIAIKAAYDYYRPIKIMYCSDSLQTEKGLIYQYSTLLSASISSIEPNDYTFQSTTAQKLKVCIENMDNPALTVDSVWVLGFVHTLVARFTENATYFLTYGNKQVQRPNYDLNHFIAKIPAPLVALSLEDEILLEKLPFPKQEPLFRNIVWLWALIGIIVLVVGWFSIKMLKNI